MGYVSRKEGILVLASLADEVDDPVLEVGIRESVHGDEVRRGPAHVLKCMEDRLPQLRLALHERHWFVIAGTLGIQAARKPDDIVAAARAAGQGSSAPWIHLLAHRRVALKWVRSLMLWAHTSWTRS
jgi:hypothetical protein